MTLGWTRTVLFDHRRPPSVRLLLGEIALWEGAATVVSVGRRASRTEHGTSRAPRCPMDTSVTSSGPYLRLIELAPTRLHDYGRGRNGLHRRKSPIYRDFDRQPDLKPCIILLRA